ncbi:actin-binding protein anillin-like protein [Dinothrombium tinctorium]|uniref:Actin-binding protein anillin-like protein n=1 Tax=Dinothrombium tinctorium TaxID=1965070 RepID=A0A443QQK2_9ACAR|nr:actin-binding protein anillin-like protein [Dinothrombium tinctorium]
MRRRNVETVESSSDDNNHCKQLDVLKSIPIESNVEDSVDFKVCDEDKHQSQVDEFSVRTPKKEEYAAKRARRFEDIVSRAMDDENVTPKGSPLKKVNEIKPKVNEIKIEKHEKIEPITKIESSKLSTVKESPKPLDNFYTQVKEQEAASNRSKRFVETVNMFQKVQEFAAKGKKEVDPSELPLNERKALFERAMFKGPDAKKPKPGIQNLGQDLKEQKSAIEVSSIVQEKLNPESEHPPKEDVSRITIKNENRLINDTTEFENMEHVSDKSEAYMEESNIVETGDSLNFEIENQKILSALKEIDELSEYESNENLSFSEHSQEVSSSRLYPELPSFEESESMLATAAEHSSPSKASRSIKAQLPFNISPIKKHETKMESKPPLRTLSMYRREQKMLAAQAATSEKKLDIYKKLNEEKLSHRLNQKELSIKRIEFLKKEVEKHQIMISQTSGALNGDFVLSQVGDYGLFCFLLFISYISHLKFRQNESLLPLYLKLQCDFMVNIEVYCLSFPKSLKKDPQKFLTLTPKSKAKAKQVNSPISSPGGPNAVRSSGFKRLGCVDIKINNCYRKKYQLEQFVSDSPLGGAIEITVNLKAEHNETLSEYLNFFEDSGWCSRWCVLKGYLLAFWRFAEDETKKESLRVIDLRKCVNPNVSAVPYEVCSRKNSFVLVTIEETQKDDVASKNKGFRTMSYKKYLLSTYLKEEFELWSCKLENALRLIRLWEADASKPYDTKQFLDLIRK